MPPPRFQHGFPHDVFLSYTHTDDQSDAGRCWVSKFMKDLRARLEIVSGHTVDIWRDEEKLGAADRFNETIAHAVAESAVLVVVLSPGYFNSNYCNKERNAFYDQARTAGRQSVGEKSRVIKVAKFRVDLNRYPPDLRELLEHRFYVEVPGSTLCKEFHLSDDPTVRERYNTKVDDVAQEIAGLLFGLEPTTSLEPTKGAIYLAECSSDVEHERDDLRRQLQQLGYDVEPKKELRLLPVREIRELVSHTLAKCRLAVYPVGAYYGFVPEGADGKSVVQIQLELAQSDARNGDLGRIIWVPEGLVPQEDTQKQFLARLRTEFAGRHFELLERPFRALATRVEDRLKVSELHTANDDAPSSGIYLVCHEDDRAMAKTVRSFLFNQQLQVEWTPFSVEITDASGKAEHEKLLQRNRAHLVLHGATTEAWLQDRIRELNSIRSRGGSRLQAVLLANPQREDKNDILVRDIDVLNGYHPVTVADALKPFLDQIAGGSPPSAAGVRS